MLVKKTLRISDKYKYRTKCRMCNAHYMAIKPGYNSRGGGGGGTLIFSYIRRLGSFYGVKILNFSILGGFQKNEYFWGMKIFFFGGVITKLDYI